jgi:RNA polymerase sigma-70 factor, ECF subfamily
LIDQVFRDEWGRVLASLIGYFRDFDLAEDAAAEAFAIAAQRWPSDGVPGNPAAWLVTTARHRAIDRLRRDRVLAAKLRLLAVAEPDPGESMETTAIPDERLELVFMCCHPALAVEAQVALTLRAVGGLSADRIARAFLVPPETMKRRLTRAKSKIKVAGIPFGVPSGPRLPERLGAVLAVGRRAARLAADRAALRQARRADRLPGGPAEPRRGGRRGRGPGRGPGHRGPAGPAGLSVLAFDPGRAAAPARPPG